MAEGWGMAVLQLLIAVVASGVMVKLLTLRQDRRKIAGEASSQEANAASVLTGASLQMVEAAQRDAAAARKEAGEIKEENQRLWAELNRTRRRVSNLEERETILENALRDRGHRVPVLPEVDYRGL